MKEKFKSTIEKGQSVLIVLPRGPYFDQVAAGLSLYLALIDRGARIVCPSPMLVEFNRLVGVDKVLSEYGSQNLTVTFVDYDPNDVDRVNADIENGKFKLTVVPKAGRISPEKRQLEMNYSGVASDTIILIGGANAGHFPILSEEDLTGKKIVHVGISELSGTESMSVESYVKPASSTSEIVAELIKELKGEISEDIAANLMAGMREGSLGFSGRNVTPQTFLTAAELMERGAKRGQIEKPQQNDHESEKKKVSEIEKEEAHGDAPKSWLEPKIIKGTSKVEN